MCLCSLVACASVPIRVEHVSTKDALKHASANALTDGHASDETAIVLRRHDLAERFVRDPAAALEALRRIYVVGNGGSAELFALSELSFLYARKGGDRSHYLAAALYAYAFAMADQAELDSERFDGRQLLARSIYSVALAEAFEQPGESRLELQGGARPLPFGELQVDFDPQSLLWAGRRLIDLVPVTELRVTGLRNMYRQAGVGTPVAARLEDVGQPDALAQLVNSKVRVPATVVLHFPDARKQIVTEKMHGRLAVYTADAAEQLKLDDGSTVPLAMDRSTALAMTMAESRFWEREFARLRGNLLGGAGEKPNGLFARDPYRPGRIPVVFVHGTASSAARWGDMVNDLDDDPEIRRNFQFWFYAYDSGNPIAYSSMLLRRSLVELVATADPEGKDACLHRMVVLGHSQGGLLTKMTAIDSADRFWQNISQGPFERATMRDSSRKTLSEALFVKPLPFVKRVIFIATPHRGSFMANPQFLRRLAARMIRFPKDVVDLSTDLTGIQSDRPASLALERIPTSFDNMSSRNVFIRTLASIPIAPGIAVNSIVGVETEGPVETGDDGVVQYSSAHLEDAESELIVHSNHSMQANPNTVQEVRRILDTHLKLGCDAR